MKPLNLDNRPCSPISSNCVIWQGPDIPCIKLCTGDSVSDVIFQLATELCTIIDTLDIKNYDLSCFNLAACPPADFQALIQFLIDQICELQGLTPGTDGTKSTCPDCVVSVATCLRNTDPSLPATMQLLDYVQLLANKICTLIDQVSVINTQITNIDARVTVLENTPPPTFTIPSIETGCLISYIPGTPASTTIDVILDTLLNNNTIGYCSLIDATGFPAEILSAVASQCIDGTSESLANPGDTMSNYPNWIETPVTAADAITNLWIALCDARLGIEGGGVVTVVASTNTSNTIEVTSATVGADTTFTLLSLYGLEFFLAGWQISSVTSSAWKIISPNTTADGFTEGQPFIKPTYVATTRTLDKSSHFITHNGVNDYVTNADFTPYGNTFGTYSADNGEFFINEAGVYLITAHMHLRSDDAGTALWSANAGSVGVGLCVGNGNTTDMYCGSHHTIVPAYTKQIDVTTERTVLVGASGAWVRMTFLNYTDRIYNGNAYGGIDGISYSIIKLRNGLTTTNI